MIINPIERGGEMCCILAVAKKAKNALSLSSGPRAEQKGNCHGGKVRERGDSATVASEASEFNENIVVILK